MDVQNTSAIMKLERCLFLKKMASFGLAPRMSQHEYEAQACAVSQDDKHQVDVFTVTNSGLLSFLLRAACSRLLTLQCGVR